MAIGALAAYVVAPVDIDIGEFNFEMFDFIDGAFFYW